MVPSQRALDADGRPVKVNDTLPVNDEAQYKLCPHGIEIFREPITLYRFTQADCAEWKAFFEDFPAKVEDISAERLHPFTTTRISKCGLRLHDGSDLEKHVQSTFSDSIRYTNTICGTSASADNLCSARAEAEQVPVLAEGSRIVVLLPDEVLSDRRAAAGERFPFRMGYVLQNEEATLGACFHTLDAALSINPQSYN
eukprot:776871-Pleurochrysis_carterae.AAC.1